VSRGETRATVTEVGAALRVLEHRGRPLVRPWSDEELMPVYSGAVLAPWPNRLADGRYRFGGREHQLPLGEPGRRTALHGLVAWERWHRVDGGEGSVSLEHALVPRPGYPFPLTLRIDYEALDDGLQATLTARNDGTEPAPYGCAWHPYLVAPRGLVDEWTLWLPAEECLQVDPDRLLPRGRVGVAGTGADLRDPRRLGAQLLDRSFTGLVTDAAGWVRVEVRDADGRGAALWCDEAHPWVHVFTGDEPPVDRSGLAVEPMTCPPDAFRSGDDLVVLDPGAEHRARWRITALGGT
jgi:aldose 1-epimerase